MREHEAQARQRHAAGRDQDDASPPAEATGQEDDDHIENRHGEAGGRRRVDDEYPEGHGRREPGRDLGRREPAQERALPQAPPVQTRRARHYRPSL